MLESSWKKSSTVYSTVCTAETDILRVHPNEDCSFRWHCVEKIVGFKISLPRHRLKLSVLILDKLEYIVYNLLRHSRLL